MAAAGYEQMGTSSKADSKFVDLERGDMLYPGIEVSSWLRFRLCLSVHGAFVLVVLIELEHLQI
jgi:hypothetical protein